MRIGINSFSQVLDSIGLASPVVKLIASNGNILRLRVLDSSRPSAYRNVDEALRLNRKITAQTFKNELCIDVNKCALVDEISITSTFITSNRSI